MFCPRLKKQKSVSESSFVGNSVVLIYTETLKVEHVQSTWVRLSPDERVHAAVIPSSGCSTHWSKWTTGRAGGSLKQVWNSPPVSLNLREVKQGFICVSYNRFFYWNMITCATSLSSSDGPPGCCSSARHCMMKRDEAWWNVMKRDEAWHNRVSQTEKFSEEINWSPCLSL